MSPTSCDYRPSAPSNLNAAGRGAGGRRALRYDLSVEARVEDGRLRVAFFNDEEAGATFYVTSMSLAGGPWSYTVGRKSHVDAEWTLTGGSSATYDHTANGPNGFLR
jgi:hypothetical protein